MELKITKELFEALGDGQKGFYTEKDGEYHLDAGALAKDRARLINMDKNHQRLVEEHKGIKAKLKEFEDAKIEAQKAADAKDLDAKVKAGEWESIQKSYEKKIEDARKEGAEENTALRAILHKRVIELDVNNMANELALPGTEPLLADRIRSRVRAKYIDGDMVPEYLDDRGQPTAFTRAEFMKIIASDPSCARILKGSDATGGGHQGSSATTTTNVLRDGTSAKQTAKPNETREDMAARWQAKIDELNKK